MKVYPEHWLVDLPALLLSQKTICWSYWFSWAWINIPLYSRSRRCSTFTQTLTHMHTHSYCVHQYCTHCLFHCCTCVLLPSISVSDVFIIKPTSGAEFSERIWFLWFFMGLNCFNGLLYLSAAPPSCSVLSCFSWLSQLITFNLLWYNAGQPRLHCLFPAPVVLLHIKTVPKLYQTIMFGHLKIAPSSNLFTS